MSGIRCQFMDCGLSSRTDSNLRKFRFPKNKELLRQWVINSGNEALLKLTDEQLHNRFVCYRHFQPEQLKQKNLPNGTVPKRWDEDLEVPQVKKMYSGTKPNPSSNSTTKNKENNAISKGLDKLVAEPGRIPTVHLKPLQNFQRNKSKTPSLGFENQNSIEKDSEDCAAKGGTKNDTEQWDIEEKTYTVILCVVNDPEKQEEEQEQDSLMERVCRTCLRVFSSEDTVVIYDEAENTPKNSTVTLKEKLDDIQPYIDFNLTERPVVVCKTCEHHIHRSYKFKQLCKSSELRLRHAARSHADTQLRLLEVINDLPPANKVDENILLQPFIQPAVPEIEITENLVNDDIIDEVILDEISGGVTPGVPSDKIIDGITPGVPNDEISDGITPGVPNDKIIDGVTPGVPNDEISDGITLESPNDELISKPTIIKCGDSVNRELNLSDMEDGWQWDTTICDPLGKPNPKKIHPWLEDHNYTSEYPKLINRRSKFNWRSKELNVLSKEFGDYLRHRKGQKLGFRIRKRLNAIKKPKNRGGPILCEICGHTFQRFKGYQTHVVLRHEGKKIVCPVCGKMIPYPYFNQHTMKHSIKQKTLAHICHKCGKCFSFRCELVKHTRIHEIREKKFQCPVCNKMYHTKCQLRVHQRCHGDKQFKCKYCSMSFHSATPLRTHVQRKHETKAIFQCHICNKVLKYKQCFEEHVNAHVNNNKYKCDLCPKSFRKKITFDIHKNKIHLNINFKCKYCKRKFYTQFNLDKHLEYVHGKKRYSNFRCYKCDKIYVREEACKQHLMTTHGICAEEVDEHVQVFPSDDEEKMIEYVEVDSEEEEGNYDGIENESSHDIQ